MSVYRPKSTIEQWRILQAVVDCGGYAHAAEALNKSQSSLNHAVAKLQQVVGVQLLEVRGRKAHLTAAGEVLLRRSRQLTNLTEEIEQLADNLEQGWEPEVKLALEMVFDRSLLVPVLDEFQQLSRGSRLVISDTVLTGTMEQIQEQAADVVISHHIPRGFIGEPIGQYSMDLVCHPEHPLAKLEQPINQNELSQYLQIVIQDTGSQPVEDEGWLKAEQRWTVSHFDEALRLIRNGLGFCWLPGYIAQEDLGSGRLAQIAVEGSSSRKGSLYMVLPKAELTGPCAKTLSELILKYQSR